MRHVWGEVDPDKANRAVVFGRPSPEQLVAARKRKDFLKEAMAVQELEPESERVARDDEHARMVRDFVLQEREAMVGTSEHKDASPRITRGLRKAQVALIWTEVAGITGLVKARLRFLHGR